jgi:dTDP-4-amino-4,6-dideoxyglucose
MPILKTSPSELAIHGGGPPAFDSRIPAFSAHAGDGRRFAELAERMFAATELPGRLVQEFEDELCAWVGVRNVIGFASTPAAIKALERAHRGEKWLVPAFGHSVLPIQAGHVECEPTRCGISPLALTSHVREDTSGVFAVHPFGRPCMIRELEDVCDEWDVPLFTFTDQALGCELDGNKLGVFGRAEVFELGRSQLVHALDSAIAATNDDLLAHRLRTLRGQRPEGVDQSMSDAAAAMGIANLESADAFVQSNRKHYTAYQQRLIDVPGVRLIRHPQGSTYQSIAVEIDAGHAGLTRNALHDVLRAENVGVAKPYDAQVVTTAPFAASLAASCLHLPSGPAATEEVIEGVSRLIELAIVRSLESPDPIRLAA